MTSLLVPETQISAWDRVADVLIVGGGCAGASAAIEAARSGAETLVVERAGALGGTSAMSGAVIYCGGGTPIQQACGFEDSVAEMVAYLSASCGERPDLEKLRRYCESSVGHFEWLCSLGVPFKPTFWPHNLEPWTDDCLYYSGSEHTHPFCTIAKPAPRGHTVQAEGSCAGGRVLMEKLTHAVAASGASVVTDARVNALVQSVTGRIVGVSARIEGRNVFFKANRGVVLTTGGFICNPEMVARYAPQGSEVMPLGGPGDDGSGIELGAAARGNLINMSAAAYAVPMLQPVQLVQGVLLDQQGRRFINEDVNHKRIGEYALLHQQGKIYLLVDQDIFARPAKGNIDIIATGDSIAEVEAEMNFPLGSLQNTVARYNEFAAQGRDPEFGKLAAHLKPLSPPPFGVFDCSVGRGAPYVAFTLGGLQTLSTGEVLDANGEKVPGLYAAGRATSCLSAQSCGSSGMQIGEGTFFGRLAGRSAAQACDA